MQETFTTIARIALQRADFMSYIDHVAVLSTSRMPQSNTQLSREMLHVEANPHSLNVWAAIEAKSTCVQILGGHGAFHSFPL